MFIFNGHWGGGAIKLCKEHCKRMILIHLKEMHSGITRIASRLFSSSYGEYNDPVNRVITHLAQSLYYRVQPSLISLSGINYVTFPKLVRSFPPPARYWLCLFHYSQCFYGNCQVFLTDGLKLTHLVPLSNRAAGAHEN